MHICQYLFLVALVGVVVQAGTIPSVINELAINDEANKWNWNGGNAAICSLPPDTGHCRAAHPRFYFNPATATCTPFLWGGCAGNSNRFHTLQECSTACGGQG